MKDTRGAEIAMRAAEEAWKGPSSHRKPPSRPVVPPVSTPSSARQPMGGMMRPSPTDPRSASSMASMVAHPHYMGRSYMSHMAPMGFSPMAVPPVTPVYAGSASRHRAPSRVQPFTAPTTVVQGTKRVANKITPSVPPRTPAVRVVFDPAYSRKKRKKGDQDEETHSYFGISLPPQPKTTALAVLSFLSNEDAYKASLVCKTWKSLAEDGELWRFP
jgi:hypothetical protein